MQDVISHGCINNKRYAKVMFPRRINDKCDAEVMFPDGIIYHHICECDFCLRKTIIIDLIAFVRLK